MESGQKPNQKKVKGRCSTSKTIYTKHYATFSFVISSVSLTYFDNFFHRCNQIGGTGSPSGKSVECRSPQRDCALQPFIVDRDRSRVQRVVADFDQHSQTRDVVMARPRC